MNKKGYTLTYTIIIIGLLMILTASIIMITFFNFQFARKGGEINTSFYANDGALEEALTELSLFTYNAEITAWEYANAKSYISDVTWISFLNDIYANINSGILSIEEGNLLIASAIKGEFEKTFYNEIYENDVAVHLFYDDTQSGLNRFIDLAGYTGISLTSPASLENDILTAMTTTLFNPSSIVAPTEISGVADTLTITIDSVQVLANGHVNMTVESDGTYHSYYKKLSVDLTLQAPNYSFSSAILTESIALRKNDLTDQVLAAKGNLVFADGSINIDGNAYAYGSSIDFKYNQNRDLYGGAIIGYRLPGVLRSYASPIVDAVYASAVDDLTASVSMTGDLASRNSIKLESGNSVLNLDRSSYANNVYIRDGADNTRVSIANNMYNYSDLFIAGDNAEIVLNNDTFTHGPLSSVNSYRPFVGELWGLYSLHPAAGAEYTRTGTVIISEASSNPSITLNAMFLGGVIRFNVFNDSIFQNSGNQEAYKTGESFTTYKNNTYYQSLGLESIYQSGIFSFLEDYNSGGTIFDLISFYHSSANLNQPDYRGIHFYTMGYNAYLDSDNKTFKDISSLDKNIIKLRDPRLDGSEFYGISSSGLLQFADADSLNSGKVYHPDRMDTDAYLANLTTVLNDVDPKANLLGYADLSDLNTGANEVDLFDDWLDLSADPLLPSDNRSADLQVYNKNPLVDTYINFDNEIAGQINLTGQLNQSDENFSGTIVSAGNIYIFADSGESFNFTGNIISEKNIYLLGGGQKNLRHDEITIYQAINKHDSLKNLYHTDSGRQIITNSISTDVSFSVGVGINTDEINVNHVTGEESGDASIVESNSIHINSWTEIE